MDKLTHDAGCVTKTNDKAPCDCGGPEFVVVGPNYFGFGGSQERAVQNMKRAGGLRGKVRCVVYRGIAAHSFQISHMDGSVSWRTQDEAGNKLPEPVRMEHPKGL